MWSSNVRAVWVELNEICTVYMRMWEDAEDVDIWADLDNIIFGEIQCCDCVAHFHLVVIDVYKVSLQRIILEKYIEG